MDRLLDLMRFDLLADVAIQEGIAANATLLEDFNLTGEDKFWQAELTRIYNHDRTETQFRENFAAHYDPRAIDEALDILSSDDWIRVFGLQVDTSLVLIDPDLLASATEVYWEYVEKDEPRIGLIEELIATTDLAEQSLSGAMNAMLAFNRGMTSVSADLGYPDDEMIALIFSSEAEMRFEISEWLHTFYLVAYMPLSDRDIETQIDVWNSQVGQDIARALNLAYDAVFDTQAYALGASLAKILQSPSL